VVGRGRIPITEAPVITDKEVRGNKEVHLTWNYPEEMNGYISGFRVYRSPNPNGLKQKVYESKAPSERTFTDVSPDITNYYIMSVFNEETEKVSKNITYAELIDSIPPLKPVGFAGTIDSTGKVWLRWKPNTDKDLDGYRVYRSNHPDFEFLLITSSVLKDTTYTDSVTLKTLTQQVYYRLRAIDLRQNQSEFGEVLALRRPDIIPPVAPLIVSAEVKKGMVVLTWINSTSEDVARHHIYRRQKDDTTFHLLADIAKTSEEQSIYEDRTITPGEVYVYQVKAEDQSGLYSTPSSPVQRKALGGLVEQVLLKKKQQLANRVVLIWDIKSEKKVERVLVYKAYGDADLQLYGNATESTYTDENLLPETTARYSIKAIYVDGTSSALSNEVVVKM
jgi:fibronectin type 3 domain-containing protein